MEQILSNYLKGIAQQDQNFAAIFKPDQLKECVKFIIQKIQAAYIDKVGRKNGGCSVNPETVYKLARDFFQEGKEAASKAQIDESEISCVLAENGKTVKEDDSKSKQENNPAKEKKHKQEPTRSKALPNEIQLDLFGGAL